MRGLTAPEVLDLFERGHRLGHPDRARLLLERAWSEADATTRDRLPVGERDRLLLALRIRTLGPEASLRAECPSCQAELEAELDLVDLLARAATVEDPFAPHRRTVGGREVVFSAPCTTHVVRALTTGPRALVAGCIESIDGEPLAEDGELDDAIVGAVSAAIEEVDPLAEVGFDFRCRDCDGSWREIFDIVSFFWAELEARARRLFHEVHALARGYGWTEAEILRLSSQRRRIYLEMVGR